MLFLPPFLSAPYHYYLVVQLRLFEIIKEQSKLLLRDFVLISLLSSIPLSDRDREVSHTCF